MKLFKCYLLSAVALTAPLTVSAVPNVVGPYVGSIKTTEAHFLYSPDKQAAKLRLTVMTEKGAKVASADANAEAEHDFVAKFHITGLTAGTTYRYKIEQSIDGKGKIVAGNTPEHHFTTVSNKCEGQIVKVGFVSCANDTTDLVWKEMRKHKLDLLCLSGDTPYVDTGDLTSIRKKHRHFLKRPDLAAMGRNISVVGTWDDHDFGRNNGNGKNAASRKVNTRRGFIEYRAHTQYGNGKEGIYHKADMGAVEVFLLDPRWFSQTAASPVNAKESTCFGKQQWQWLLESIRNSKAPFKVLLQGQIWQDKKNGEIDDMHTYWAERDALLDIIKKEKITGVVLIGGDIHVSRYLMHPQRVGYDLHDFVTSPSHTGVIKSLNVYHQDLEWSRAAANQFLTMTADTTQKVPELTVKFLDRTGKENLVKTITLVDLTPAPEAGLNKDLRAYWSFDSNTDNTSKLGARLNGKLKNGASISKDGKVGGALKLTGSGSQFLDVARGMLDDNSTAYTITSWVKADSLPAAKDSKTRSFIFESKVNNHCKLPKASATGYAISAGLRSCTDPNKINLQLHTETLVPQPVGSQRSPRNKPQGSFDFFVDRSLLKQKWTHIAVTFDAKELKLYLNGKLAKTHPLLLAAPIAETGGLVIGGHRGGTGRNFDGMIDEVAIWNRTLSDAEINTIVSKGLPKN